MKMILFSLMAGAVFQQSPKLAAQEVYDPSRAEVAVKTELTSFEYDGREVPLKLYLPESQKPAAVILLSHGLGGNREVGAYLGNHWAGRGFVVVAMQHAGSDSELFKGVRPLQKFSALKKAANAKNAASRYKDVRETINYLEQMNQANGKLAGRLNLKKIGMSGHSFGAVTTQAVSGQNYGRLGQMNTDNRIKAAFAMSPSEPNFSRGGNPFEKVRVPWLLMTGTEDEGPIGRAEDAASRRKVFQQLPNSGHFFELCLFDAQHSAFGDTRIRRQSRNPKHHPIIQAISSAFWDAYLLDNKQAEAWLKGPAVKKLLDSKDEWLKK